MSLRNVLIVLVVLAISGCVASARPSNEGASDALPDFCDSNAGKRFDSDIPRPIGILAGDSVAEDVLVPSYDGHNVPITVHRPVEATPDRPVPVLLDSHGWSGTRIHGPNAFRDYVQAGFGVVSIDMRGHGEARATSEARVHHMEYEIRDVQAVISFVATLPWVVMDNESDPRIGAIGGSYGGGYQLLTAAVDDRLDAIAPDITWNNLARSLAPNDAVKSAWIDVLYGAGNAQARLHQDIHVGFSVAMSQNRLSDGSMPGEPDLKSQFLDSSPTSYPDEIDVPALISQGANDTLFSFNEAIHNYEQIRQDCRSVRLVTHLMGHILNTRGTIPVPAPRPLGLQDPSGGTPCGSLDDYRAAFYQVHLLGLAAGMGPRVCIALEDGTAINATAFPIPGTENVTIETGANLLFAKSLPERQEVLLWTATEEQLLIGIPTVRAAIESVTPDTMLYFGFIAGKPGEEGRLLNWQVWPARTSADVLDEDHVQEFEIGALSARIQAGEEVRLLVATSSDQFAHNGGRIPGVATVGSLDVTVPVLAP